MMLKKRFYPKAIKVKDVKYRILFVDQIHNEPEDDEEGEAYGMCDDGQKIIYLKNGMNESETWGVFIHELCHAIEKEHEYEIDHDAIYVLQTAFKQVFKDNFVVYPKK